MLENRPTLTNKWIIGYDQATRESSLILFIPFTNVSPTLQWATAEAEMATENPSIYCVENKFLVVK